MKNKHDDDCLRRRRSTLGGSLICTCGLSNKEVKAATTSSKAERKRRRRAEDEHPIQERFVIMRQLKYSGKRGWEDNTMYTASESVSGITLERVETALLKALTNGPISASPPAEIDLEALVIETVNSLYEPMNFHHDDSMDASEKWKRGMFKSKKEEADG